MRCVLFLIAALIAPSCSFSQGWFESVLQKIPLVEIPTYEQALRKLNPNPISISQYNELIGSKVGFIEKNGQLEEEIVYGNISGEDMPEGLNLPTVSIVAKITLAPNAKTIIIRIDEDPKLDALPILQICNFDSQNRYLSTLMISGGETETYNGKITADKIMQTIFSEGKKEVNSYTINGKGYFRLENSVITEN